MLCKKRETDDDDDDERKSYCSKKNFSLLTNICETSDANESHMTNKYQLRQNEVWTKNKFWLFLLLSSLSSLSFFFFNLYTTENNEISFRLMRIQSDVWCLLTWNDFCYFFSISLAPITELIYILTIHIRTWFFCYTVTMVEKNVYRTRTVSRHKINTYIPPGRYVQIKRVYEIVLDFREVSLWPSTDLWNEIPI